MPFIEEVKQELKNKAIGLFGSYGWSEGDNHVYKYVTADELVCGYMNDKKQLFVVS